MDSGPKKFKPADRLVPQLFTLGAIHGAFKMRPGIESNFVPARAESWPWALGVQHGCAHDYGNSAVLQITWMHGIISARLPANADGDILLGSAFAPPWKFAWREPRLGAHAIWETTDDRHGAVNPALVSIRGRRNP